MDEPLLGILGRTLLYKLGNAYELWSIKCNDHFKLTTLSRAHLYFGLSRTKETGCFWKNTETWLLFH
jgi:hypothetical protein